MEQLICLSKDKISEIIELWHALNTLVNAGVMPDKTFMDVQNNDVWIDRWVTINQTEFCITNKVNEKPHLADVITLWHKGVETDPDEVTIDELRKLV